VIRRLILSLLCLSVFIFTSCVEGEEEIWIHENGSGRILAHYELPGRIKNSLGNPENTIRALKIIDEKEDGIEIQQITYGEKNGKIVFHLEVTFEDILDLFELVERNEQTFIEEAGSDSAQIDSIVGVIDVKLEDLTPMLKRTVNLGSLFPPIVKNRPGMLGPSNFKYTIHLPAKVKDSNAHSISDDGKTVTWTFLLKNHFNQPMLMTVTTELPIPWWAWAALAVIVFGLAWLVWRFVIRRFL
jgi:hypothetical protein